MPVLEVQERSIAGCVVCIDRFGNAVTNVDRGRFERLAAAGGVDIEVGGCAVGRLVETYADIGSGEVCALFGSNRSPGVRRQRGPARASAST